MLRGRDCPRDRTMRHTLTYTLPKSRRILRLLKLNVQLLFVNDGPRRPWKRNKRGGGKLDYELTKLTHQLLRSLKVPYHQGPGEAEAECARLQALGIVDAVWSDDGDALMFGCGTLIRQHKNGSGIVKDYIRVYQASALLEKYDLDPDGLVLFAVLAGGDYNTQGLRGCGPKTAALLSKRRTGLATSLRDTSEASMPMWRVMLQDALRRYGKAIEVPFGFPEFKALHYYRNPTVSTDDRLHDLRGLRNGWDRPITQAVLRIILRERFNFTTREFLKHIAPVFVARRLARAESGQREENLELGIQLKRTRRKKEDGEDISNPTEAKITFSPLPVVEIDLSERPPDEDWTKFAAKDGTPYDPTQSVECELLYCFLKHGLPAVALEYAIPAKRKRTEETTPAKKRKTTPAVGGFGAEADNGDFGHAADAIKKASTTRKKRGRPKKQRSSPSKPHVASNLTATDPNRGLSEDPMPVFRYPPALFDLQCKLLDSGNGMEAQVRQGEPNHTEQDRLKNMAHETDSAKTHGPVTSTPRLTPGDPISPKTLRALRASAFLPSASSGCPPGQHTGSNELSSPWSKPFVEHEVIDLT